MTPPFGDGQVLLNNSQYVPIFHWPTTDEQFKDITLRSSEKSYD